VGSMMSNLFSWLLLVTIARAEIVVTSFGMQLGNVRLAMYNSVFPYAIWHGCILRFADDIEDNQLATAQAFAKKNLHPPSNQVVPLFQRFFNFTRGQAEPPACNMSRSVRDWYHSSRLGRKAVDSRTAQNANYKSFVNSNALRKEAARALNRVFGINSTHAFGCDCRATPPYTAAHVRSGDISYGSWDEDGGWRTGSVHAGYGQPSLSYYVSCIAAARRDGVKRVVVLCEDFRNTVCLALRTMTPLVDGLHVRRYGILETLQTLGCASFVCTGIGTFAEIASNSYHNRNHTRSRTTDIHFPATNQRGMDNAAIHTDGELWPSRKTTQKWRNTCLQREGMLL